MLDVHPPHQAAHSWRDFFIHIATIVVGLLIAIGLEQIVEHVHQRYELRETREALAEDLQANNKAAARNVRNWRWEMAELKNNLLVLEFIRSHPGTPQEKLPGDLRWLETPKLWHTAAWSAAEANGLVRLLPLEVANRDRSLYMFLDGLTQQNVDDWNAFNAAARYDFLDSDPTHFTPAQLDQVITATEVAMEKHLLVGYSLALLNQNFSELGSPLTYQELAHFRPEPNAVTEADRKTLSRLRAAGYPE